MKKCCVQPTDLVCLECGNVATIMRSTKRLKPISHIKNLWCYKCMDVTNHYEVKDIGKFMATETFSEVKLYVKDIVKNGREKDIERTNSIFKKILKR